MIDLHPRRTPPGAAPGPVDGPPVRHCDNSGSGTWERAVARAGCRAAGCRVPGAGSPGRPALALGFGIRRARSPAGTPGSGHRPDPVELQTASSALAAPASAARVSVITKVGIARR
jgi:hypothetical protein